MPRATGMRFAADFAQLRKRTGQLLVKLRGVIRTTENELASLKKEEAMLATLAGVRTMVSRRPVGSRPSRTSRINWTNVLERMPSQFKAGDVRKVRSVQNKRASEIFAAIARWIDAVSLYGRRRSKETFPSCAMNDIATDVAAAIK